MSYPTLAEHVVDVLAKLVSRTLTGPQLRAADSLFDAVIGRLRRTGTVGAFELFAADPSHPARRRPLLDVLNRQFSDDPGFRELVAGMVENTEFHASDSGPEAESPTRRAIPWRRVAIAVAAIAVVIGGIFGGRAAYVALTEEPVPDGTTTCRSFFAMASEEQRSLLERVFRARNNPIREKDPWIVASVLYGCGQNPERTVNDVIDSQDNS